MPNYCNNSATITATTDEASELLKNFERYIFECEKLKQTPEFFNVFRPVPSDLPDGDRYEWVISNWGCKWDGGFTNSNLDCESGVIKFSEDTPWGPPIDFYRFMETKGFEVYATYYEPGAGFIGEYSDGSDYSEDIPCGDETFRNVVDSWNDGSYYSFNDDVKFESLKTGDLIQTTNNETFIFVGMEVIQWNKFRDDNEQMFNHLIREWDSTIDEICSLNCNIISVEMITDNSSTEVRKGYIIDKYKCFDNTIQVRYPYY